jgi:hypothetical protein
VGLFKNVSELDGFFNHSPVKDCRAIEHFENNATGSLTRSETENHQTQGRL